MAAGQISSSDTASLLNRVDYGSSRRRLRSAPRFTVSATTGFGSWSTSTRGRRLPYVEDEPAALLYGSIQRGAYRDPPRKGRRCDSRATASPAPSRLNLLSLTSLPRRRVPLSAPAKYRPLACSNSGALRGTATASMARTRSQLFLSGVPQPARPTIAMGRENGSMPRGFETVNSQFTRSLSQRDSSVRGAGRRAAYPLRGIPQCGYGYARE